MLPLPAPPPPPGAGYQIPGGDRAAPAPPDDALAVVCCNLNSFDANFHMLAPMVADIHLLVETKLLARRLRRSGVPAASNQWDFAFSAPCPRRACSTSRGGSSPWDAQFGGAALLARKPAQLHPFQDPSEDFRKLWNAARIAWAWHPLGDGATGVHLISIDLRAGPGCPKLECVGIGRGSASDRLAWPAAGAHLR